MTPEPPSPRTRVAIIGATGSVGQEFVQSLAGHAWFKVTQIAASGTLAPLACQTVESIKPVIK